MSEYVGEGQFTRVYRGALAQPTAEPDERLELALKQVKTRLAHKQRDYIISEVWALALSFFIVFFSCMDVI